MTQEILKLFMEKGFLLDKEMLSFFNQLQDENLAREIIEKISVISKEKVITKNLINEHISKFKSVFYGAEDDKRKII